MAIQTASASIDSCWQPAVSIAPGSQGAPQLSAASRPIIDPMLLHVIGFRHARKTSSCIDFGDWSVGVLSCQGTTSYFRPTQMVASHAIRVWIVETSRPEWIKCVWFILRWWFDEYSPRSIAIDDLRCLCGRGRRSPGDSLHRPCEQTSTDCLSGFVLRKKQAFYD